LGGFKHGVSCGSTVGSGYLVPVFGRASDPCGAGAEAVEVSDFGLYDVHAISEAEGW